jgi:hypothetical protein
MNGCTGLSVIGWCWIMNMIRMFSRREKTRKKGIFADRNVEDPRASDSSADEYSIRRYETNRRIIRGLREDYDLETYGNLLVAAKKIVGSEDSLDFLVTDMVPVVQTQELVKERDTALRSLARRIGKLRFEERARALEGFMDEEERFFDSVYSVDRYCLDHLHKYYPRMTIIAYTSAPRQLRQMCLDKGVIDYGIPRIRCGFLTDIDAIKKAIEAGR